MMEKGKPPRWRVGCGLVCVGLRLHYRYRCHRLSRYSCFGLVTINIVIVSYRLSTFSDKLRGGHMHYLGQRALANRPYKFIKTRTLSHRSERLICSS